MQEFHFMKPYLNSEIETAVAKCDAGFFTSVLYGTITINN